MKEIRVIPRKLLFADPERSNVKISPDGKYISFLAPLEGVNNVWVAPLYDIKEAKPITRDKGRGIYFYLWAYDNEHIIYLQDEKGDENWRIYSVNIKNCEIKNLTPFQNVQARIIHLSYKKPNQILVGINDRDIRFHDIYLIDILTGEKNLVFENKEGFFEFFADNDLQIRFAYKSMADGSVEILIKQEKDLKTFLNVPPEDNLTTAILSIDDSGETLYLADSCNRNTSALFEVDLNSGKKNLLAEDEKADLSDFLIHPIKGYVQAVSFTYHRKKWKVIDKSVEEDLNLLTSAYEGDLDIVSRNLEDNLWLVGYNFDNVPYRYYIYDRKSKEIKFLFTTRPELEKYKLSRMHSLIIPSRDGLSLLSYLTLPYWEDPDEDGVPQRPLPTVLLVHGGPWWRDYWGYNAMHQWLSNRGYAVLSVNFRGSTGFGKDFINASNREWGGKMHDDLIDAVNFLVEKGIAQRDKIAIFGGSYGGYAVLVGLTFTPDVFACGVDIVGPSNLTTFMENIPPYWVPFIPLLSQRVGDINDPEDREFLKSRSPLFYVDRIKRPLLIAHGANDPRVKKSESDQIVYAMKEKGIPVTYVLYPDEGHGFLRQENRLSFFAIAEVFLSNYLGGRFEPFKDDLKGSSLEVLEGIELIPGLKEVLQDLKKEG